MSGALGKFIEIHRPPIEEEIARFLEDVIEEAPSARVREYYENLREYLLRGGKRLRPISMIATYEGFGGQVDAKIYRASISVELLHASSLIHDDIMDESPTRRGGPAFHVLGEEWFSHLDVSRVPHNVGISVGILGGDSLLGLGLEALYSAGFASDRADLAAAEYVKAYRRLIEGQLMDIYLSCKEELPTEDEVLQMLSLKTGALFAASLKMGAMLAEAPASAVAALESYGLKVGVAFQIRDDILGLFGDPKITGKPADSDVKEGKRTLLIIKALGTCSGEARRKALSILGNPNASDEDVEFVRELVRDTGSLDYAESKAIELINDAKRALKELEGIARSELIELLDELAEALVFRNR
ncbi:MAG TPA: polyprenyl synthetase family protein [Candidatus Korarchaeota archaeon]|nr:polyprenyl synthetase family protein [Candidatus Korarchaeota archaeon]